MNQFYPTYRILLALVLMVLFACKNDPGSSNGSTQPTVDPAQIKVPRFNRDTAYAYVQNQVDFGPRNPGSAGHQACKDWLLAKLQSFGATVSRQDFEGTPPTGESFSCTNIFAQFNPQSTNRGSRKIAIRNVMP